MHHSVRPQRPQNFVPTGYVTLHPGQSSSTGCGFFQAISAPPKDAPHLPQNFVPPACSVPQRVQRTLAGAGGTSGWLTLGYERGEGGGGGSGMAPAAGISSKVVLPQRPQNFAPAANRAPHFVHATTPGVLSGAPATLPKLPPCEGVNPLDGADLNCA